MRIRKLEMPDSKRMLEWMHDKKATEYLLKDFKRYTLKDCKEFIKDSQEFKKNCHMAIDDNGIYMGTVSLKNIYNNTAEFAFVLHPDAVGKGYSDFAIKNILLYGFENLGLEKIYWNVMPENVRAIRVYERNGFRMVKYREIKKLGGGKIFRKRNRIISLVSCQKRRIGNLIESSYVIGGGFMNNKCINVSERFLTEVA